MRVHEGKITEDLNLRASISSYASTNISPQLNGAGKRREYLPARDVRWSTGNWEHVIATAATNGRIALYDLNAPGTKTELAWLHEHTGQINKLDFDPFAGYLLLSAGQDKSVRLWDLREPRPEKARLRFDVRSAVRDVRWSPSEALDFAICADGGVIQKWDARSPSGPILSISGHEKACYSLDWHPDGRHVISGGFDKFIRVWDFQSDNRRQKPVFQLRAPHAIRNVRWRPACRPAKPSDSAYWQSTQVAVSYYHDDPRLHIWDLRRPLLPFCELDRYNLPANDLLWANQDMLWTVGDEGIFTQWDVKHVTPFYNQLSPCASAFMPDGEYYMFSEDRGLRRGSSQDDPAVGFLSIPHDKLSSGDDGAASRSLSDDEAAIETTMGPSFRRHEKGVFSSRSNKSQANSPHSTDDKPLILSLHKSVLDRHDLFSNNQVGASGFIPGVAAEPEVVGYLTSHYATPSTADERMHAPDSILPRLQDAFKQNAAACDMVSRHRMAQSWRILGAVILSELKDWADANRARRRADAARRRETLESFRLGASRANLSPLAGLPNRGSALKGESRSHTLMSSLFKGIVEDHAQPGSEVDSTSNMTTPLAKPLPNSPPSGRKRWSQTSSEDSIDDIALLPPSLLSSHSTAAAAARALIDNSHRVTDSTPSSPEIAKHSTLSNVSLETGTKSPIQPVKRSPTDSSKPKVGRLPQQDQEHRRAVLRDYRVQARPIFSLDDSTTTPASAIRHDSGESFTMFSASTDSSQKNRSFGQSFESPRPDGRPPSRREHDHPDFDRDDDFEGSFSEEFGRKRSGLKPSSSGISGEPEEPESGVAATEKVPGAGFGADVSPKARIQVSAEEESRLWNTEHPRDSAAATHFDTAVSSSPDIFHFEEGAPIPKPRIHTSNPIRMEGTKTVSANQMESTDGSSGSISMEELDRETYLYQDFRPIDLSKYEPKLPFAWSSLPLICQSISFDIEHGIGHAQFATHLLLHIHPYFFNPSFRKLKRAEGSAAESLADRLMTPHLGHRIIENVFENHVAFLTQMGLFQSAALLRKLCVEFEYPRIYTTHAHNKQASGGLGDGEPMSLSIVCSKCQSPMPLGKQVCERCQRVRSVCPICQSLRDGPDHVPNSLVGENEPSAAYNNNMWLLCQACGHSGHVRCLTEWFDQPFSEGTCPTQGCGCDCGPGLGRKHRIQQQIKREDEAKLIRGNKSGGGAAMRDPLRAAPSPAVDKVRAALRDSVGAERGTQSSDERSMSGRRVSSRGRLPGLSSSRKSVRLVTPGEEDGQGPSRS